MQWYGRQLVDWSQGNFGLSGSLAYSNQWQWIDVNSFVFPGKKQIVLDHQCHRKLQRTFTDREESWLLALKIKPRRPLCRPALLSRLILPRYVMKYNVFGSSFFTNLPAAKATENSAKYTKVNKVEVMTFSAIK